MDIDILLQEVFNENVAEVRKLLRQKRDANIALPNGWSALMDASMKGNSAIVRLLLEHGANPNAVSDDNHTALWQALLKRDTRIVRLLLEAGADVEYERDNDTPLMKACYLGDTSMATLLIAYGADINKGNRDNWTPLMDACMKGNMELVQNLLMMHPELNTCSHNGDTALWLAVRNKHTEIARSLLIYGANPMCCRMVHSLMICATELNDIDILERLRAKGCDVNWSNEDGWSPLMNAAMHGNIDIIRWLLRNGAIPTYCLVDGTSAAGVAARHNNQAAETLLNHAYRKYKL